MGDRPITRPPNVFESSETGLHDSMGEDNSTDMEDAEWCRSIVPDNETMNL